MPPGETLVPSRGRVVATCRLVQPPGRHQVNGEAAAGGRSSRRRLGRVPTLGAVPEFSGRAIVLTQVAGGSFARLAEAEGAFPLSLARDRRDLDRTVVDLDCLAAAGAGGVAPS